MFMSHIYQRKIHLLWLLISTHQRLLSFLFSEIFWGLLLPEPPCSPEHFNDSQTAKTII